MIDFFEFSNEMLCLADSRGFFTKVNQAWTKTLGWTSAELTSRPYFSFVHPDDLQATIREAELLLSGQHETIRFENRYRCPDGSYRWLAWHATLARESGQLVATARDVTEQKQQAEALREAEARFRTLTLRAPIGIAEADASGNIFFVNDKWCELADVEPAETLGFGWQAFVHPDDLPGLLAAWQLALLAGEELPPYEFRFRHRNGEIRWASGSVSMLKGEAGQVVGQIATVHDITPRKVAEQRFRGIYERAPLGIALLDSQSGRFLQINPKLAEMIGSSEVLLCERTIPCLTHPEDRVPFEDQMSRLLRGEVRHFNLEHRLIRNNGSTVWVSLTVVPMWQFDETPFGLLAIVEDISERKANLDALREAEERFRQLATHGPVGIAEADAQGRCTFVNDRWGDMAGIEPALALGDGWRIAIHPEDRERLVDEWTSAVARGDEISGEFRFLKPDGDVTWAQFWSSAVRNDDGSPRIYISSIVDVTERKQAMATLEAEQDLLRQSIELRDQEHRLIAYDLHDGMIQYALGALMHLESFQAKLPTPEDRKPLEPVLLALRQTLAEGRRVMNGIRTPVLDQHGVIAAIEELVQEKATPSTRIEFEPPAEELGRLAPEWETAIYRMAQEGLTNALKHSQSPRVKIVLALEPQRLRLTVRDWGIGCEQRNSGRGVHGLRGIKERTRLLKGNFRFDSAPGQGTTIEVELPLRPELVGR